jgi:hydrogenase maturation factor HypE
MSELSELSDEELEKLVMKVMLDHNSQFRKHLEADLKKEEEEEKTERLVRDFFTTESEARDRLLDIILKEVEKRERETHETIKTNKRKS